HVGRSVESERTSGPQEDLELGSRSGDSALRQLRASDRNKEGGRQAMRVLRHWCFLITMLMFCATAVYSHHSFSPVYAGTKHTTVSGVVTKFRFVNPHAMMYLDSPDASGTVTKWVVEFDGRLNLSNYGWTENSIKSGEKVTVTGNPSHTEPNRLFFNKL